MRSVVPEAISKRSLRTSCTDRIIRSAILPIADAWSAPIRMHKVVCSKASGCTIQVGVSSSILETPALKRNKVDWGRTDGIDRPFQALIWAPRDIIPHCVACFCAQVAALRADAGCIEEAELQVGRRAVFRRESPKGLTDAA
jgi:hypothetical protein